jgi:aconitate hydratase
MSQDSFKTRRNLTVCGQEYTYFSLKAAENSLGDLSRLPFSLKVLLENLLRYEDGRTVSADDIQAMAAWLARSSSEREIAFRPARVLMQDFTGVPAVVDLAAMREAMQKIGGDPQRINPLSEVDLVIDHSVMVDVFGTRQAFAQNVALEFARNRERYAFLRWGQTAFDKFRVVPPGTGICHQVNLEYLAQTVWVRADESGRLVAFPDTLVGTDSHTTMINGLAVLGWGVGGIEAEAAMLGQPISMLIPEVVGVKLSGKLPEGSTATDLVLTITQMLRKHGVVGKFVEFYGAGVAELPLADRATIANMAPEYGATCGFFPIDGETIKYLHFTGRAPSRVELVEAYAKAQGLWFDPDHEPVFSQAISLDLASIRPSLAGPKRPQDRVLLEEVGSAFEAQLRKDLGERASTPPQPVAGAEYKLQHGDVVMAAITSCTNTSNPSVMVGAGLLARKARARGLKVKPWVKTSLAPGSQVVSAYLQAAGLEADLDALGFHLVGYGCTTCIGNSGPLPEAIAAAIESADLTVAAVLSGNRNFEGRISPHIKANYLASPPLVVAYALAGRMTLDLSRDPIGHDPQGQAVYLRDIWPSSQEIAAILAEALTPQMFQDRYANVFAGGPEWQAIPVAKGLTYDWQAHSTYIGNPPFFQPMAAQPAPISDIKDARLFALFGDSITTDHISPAGSIKKNSPAGQWLIANGVKVEDFNSYGARRGQHEVMMRGTFANIRIKNLLMGGEEGGITIHVPTGQRLSFYDAAMRYQQEDTPLIIIAGKEYGTGSSRDWAAKGTRLLGVKAVIAESFERIHRSNLIGMGVLPLQFLAGENGPSLGLTGSESFTLTGISGGLKPGQLVSLSIMRADGSQQELQLQARLDTVDEVEYYRHGGILHYVLRNLSQDAPSHMKE